MTSLPNQPQSIGKILDFGIKLYVRGLAKVFPVSLFISLISMGPDLLQANPEMLAGMEPSTMGSMMIVYGLVLIVLALSIYAGMIRYFGELARGGSPTVGASIKQGLRKFFPVLLASILYFIALMLGMVAFVIPGFILMLTMYFYSTAIMLDNKGIIESLKFSHRLVWGNWWRTAAVITVPIMIMMGLYAILMTILGVNMAMMAGIDDVQQNQAQIVFWFALAAAVVNSLVYPLFYAVTVTLYNDLKLRKGGGDLEARLASA